MSAIFALANQKGGVAKTTTTGILAAGLKKQGLSVLTIDCDPQGNLSMSVAAENQDSATMYEVMKGTVSAREAIQHTPSCDIIPANTILVRVAVRPKFTFNFYELSFFKVTANKFSSCF